MRRRQPDLIFTTDSYSMTIPPELTGVMQDLLESHWRKTAMGEPVGASVNPLSWHNTKAQLGELPEGGFNVPNTCRRPVIETEKLTGEPSLQMQSTLKMRRLAIVDKRFSQTFDCGHTRLGIPRTTTAPVCLICQCLRHRTRDRIVCESPTYLVGQAAMMFSCKRGHRFTASTRITDCPTCNAERLVYAKFGPGMSVVGDILHTRTTTRLLWKCTKQRHDPACTTCSGRQKCGNVVPHDHVFYATEQHARMSDAGAFRCSNDHAWTKGRSIQLTAEVLKAIIGAPLDDPTFEYGFEATGYNAKHRIVLVHDDDTVANICSAITREWCAQNHAVYVHVASGVGSLKALVQVLVGQLPADGRTLQERVADELSRLRAKRSGHTLIRAPRVSVIPTPVTAPLAVIVE